MWNDEIFQSNAEDTRYVINASFFGDLNKLGVICFGDSGLNQFVFLLLFGEFWLSFCKFQFYRLYRGMRVHQASSNRSILYLTWIYERFKEKNSGKDKNHPRLKSLRRYGWRGEIRNEIKLWVLRFSLKIVGGHSTKILGIFHLGFLVGMA